MTQEEAKKLKKTIEKQFRGRIKAEINTVYTSTGRWGLDLKLIAGQRTAKIWSQAAWESILMAWQWFIGIEIKPREPRATKGEWHLVDGVAMYIFPMKRGYWVGRYTANKKQYKKYFGKKDPRGQYPACPKPTRIKGGGTGK